MFSNAAKKRKRNFNNLLRSIQRNQTFRQKIISFFYFKHTCMFLQTLPKQRIIWMHEREERWFDAMWENRHSPDFQLQWKQDFRMNGFNFEKLVNEVRHEVLSTTLRVLQSVHNSRILLFFYLIPFCFLFHRSFYFLL